MNKYSQKALFVFLIYVTCAILHVSVAELHLKNTLIISCILFLFNSYVVLESKGSTLCFLQPSVFGVNYIYLSMALGALTFASDIVILPRMITESSRWTDGVTPIAFLGGFVAVVILISDYRPTTASWLLPGRSPITMLVLLLATIGTAVAGKATNFIFLPETTGGMFMLYVLHVIGLRNGKTRVLFYLAAIVPLTVLFAEDKRDAIFLVVPIAFLELIVRDYPSFTLGVAVRTFLVVPVIGALILMASVLRSPSYAGISSISETWSAVVNFAAGRFFWGYASLNFELAYTYFHTFNAINYVLADRLMPLLGSTYVKPLFILIPREWIEWKPWGASYLYALRFDKAYRLAGGSWAVSMVGEAFVNFRIVGAVILPFVLAMLDGLFRRFVLIREQPKFPIAVAALYFPVAFMNYARGSGLDVFLIMMIVATATAVVGSMGLHYGKNGRIWRLPRIANGGGGSGRADRGG